MNTRLFWSRVKSSIKKKGLTQHEVAKACKIPYSTLRNWMNINTNPPLIDAHRISKYLGVSIEYLISGQGHDQISKTKEKVLILLKDAEAKLEKIRRN